MSKQTNLEPCPRCPRQCKACVLRTHCRYLFFSNEIRNVSYLLFFTQFNIPNAFNECFSYDRKQSYFKVPSRRNALTKFQNCYTNREHLTFALICSLTNLLIAILLGKKMCFNELDLFLVISFSLFLFCSFHYIVRHIPCPL